MKVRVKEVNPLKQGLRQKEERIQFTTKGYVKEVNPLKQGLRQKEERIQFTTKGYVKEVNPLKQGLRLCSLTFTHSSPYIC